jgi:hypothetical protein
MKTLNKILSLMNEDSRPEFKKIVFNFKNYKKPGFDLLVSLGASWDNNRTAILTIEPSFCTNYKYMVYGPWIRSRSSSNIHYFNNIFEVKNFIIDLLNLKQ